MQLTLHTDYALRVLIYLNAHDEQTIPVSEIAARYGISHHHLMKVVQRLSQLGYVQATRGRNGGLRLAKPAASINVGSIVREIEPSLDMAECFNNDSNTCPISPACDLKRMLYEARSAFLAVLDGYHLPDLTRQGAQIRHLLASSDSAPPD